MSYESHKILLDSALNTYVQRKKQLEQELKDWKAAHRERIISIITCHHNDPDTVDKLASYAYVFNGNIDSNTLGGMLNVDNNKGSYSIVKHIKSFKLNKACAKCDVRFTFYIQSRSSSISYDKNGETTNVGSEDLCPSCAKNRDDEWKRVIHDKRLFTQSKQTKQSQDLETLKTMPYAEYLQTDHWKATRKRALRTANYKCELCNTKGELHIHHKTYERRGNEWNADLIALCAHCHAKFHDKLETEEVIL